MFTVQFTAIEEDREMPVAVFYNFLENGPATCLLVDTKTEMIEKLLDCPDDPLCNGEMIDTISCLGVVCGELLAIIKAARPHCDEGKPLHFATSSLLNATEVLGQAHDFIAQFMRNYRQPTGRQIVEGRSVLQWRAAPYPLELDWSIIGRPNFVTED